MNASGDKYNLFLQLKKARAFWSYSNVQFKSLSDDILIELSLLYLSENEVKNLFDIYPAKKIKAIWCTKLLIQEPYFHNRNILYAKSFFYFKNPELYVKRASYYYIKKRIAL